MTGYVITLGALGEYTALSVRFTRTTLADLAYGVAEALGVSAEELFPCPACLTEVAETEMTEVTFSLQSCYSRTASILLCDACADSTDDCAGCGTPLTMASYRAADRVEASMRETGAMDRYSYLGASMSCDDCGGCCQSCADDHRYCESCEVYFCDDYSHDECDEYGSEDGYGDTDSLGLLGYSHKPSPVFHGRDVEPFAPTFGMELETAYVTRSHVDAMNGLGGERYGAWYAKADCSVRGAEFVSHPRTYASWVAHMSELEPVLARMIADGANDGGIDGNGIHVHVGRDAFTGRAHLARFATMIDGGRDWVTKLARRDNEEWSAFRTIARHRRYNSHTDYRTGRKVSTLYRLTNPYGGDGARGAVNLQNASTVEVRVWRQSLQVADLLQAVGFVAALVEYTKGMTVQEVMAGALTGEAFAEWLSFRPEYAPVLADLVDVFPNVEAPKYLAPVS